jgi:hypothetical protein
VDLADDGTGCLERLARGNFRGPVMQDFRIGLRRCGGAGDQQQPRGDTTGE